MIGTRPRTAGAVLVLAMLGCVAPAAAATFASNFGTVTRPFAEALGESIGRALPVTSASPGVVYTFDFATGAPKRETEVLGQLFLERADTVGRQRWNLGLSYQHVKIDTFNGADIGELRDTRLPIAPSRLTIPLFDIDLETHELTGTATYGVTDDLDLNLTVPLLYSEFGLRSVFRFPGRVDRPPTVRATKLGVGDIFLRGKYRLLSSDLAHLAFGVVLRVPSGDKENFQGTGDLELAPPLYASTRAFHPARALALQAYFNAGPNFDVDAVDRSEARWGVGVDGRFGERISAAVAVLGRHAFSRIARPGAFDLPRIDPRTGRHFTAPLFGFRAGRPDFYDISVGGRVDLWRDVLFVFADAIVPLNRDGFRADVIPLAGLEATF